MKAYTTYGNGLGSSATVLANKMTFQLFAKFVLETPVPKGHLDMTSLLLAPLEVNRGFNLFLSLRVFYILLLIAAAIAHYLTNSCLIERDYAVKTPQILVYA